MPFIVHGWLKECGRLTAGEASESFRCSAESRIEDRRGDSSLVIAWVDGHYSFLQRCSFSDALESLHNDFAGCGTTYC